MIINKVSELTGMTAETIRYYEKIGLIPPIKRVNGIRHFDEDDVKWLDFVKHMRAAGLSVEALTLYVQLFQKGQETVPERKGILAEQVNLLKEKITKLTKTLDMLEFKLENYETHVIPAEDSLESFNRHVK